MFYIYRYTDPSNNQPFYIGKGKGTRATDHMMNVVKSPKNKTRFKNKIEALKQAGTPPIIHYIIENIIDEDQAYELEKKYIKLYGRKGYDDGGVLLNVCEDSRPPNHKGKTYKEIYGDGWEEQIEKRRKIQLERGGFGPKKHSEETKNKISESNVGKKANENQIENSKRMGLMNKGRTKTDLQKEKIRQKMMGRFVSEETREKIRQHRINTPKKKCDYCDKEVQPNIFARYHGDKCKYKGTLI